MKSIKKLTALVLAVVMCLALVGCNYAQTVEIKTDGKAAVTMKMSISEKELEKLAASTGDTTSFDEFKKESDKNGLTETIDGVKYYSSVETKTNSLDEINESLGSAGEFTTTDFWAYGNGAISSSEDYQEVFKAAEIEITADMTVKFPYKVVDTNCEKKDDYTITYNEGKTIVYAITEKSTAAWTKAADKDAAITELAKVQYTPKKVKGLKVAYKNTKTLKISWTPLESSFVTGYKVEKKIGNGKWKAFKTVAVQNLKNYDGSLNLFCTDKKISANKKYSYRVKAYYSDAKFTVEGVYSAAKKITTANFKSTPVVKVKNSTVSLKKAIKNVAGYQIKYSKNSNLKGAKTLNVKKLPKTIKASSGKYYFKVRAYCKGVDGKKVFGKWSKTVSATI